MLLDLIVIDDCNGYAFCYTLGGRKWEVSPRGIWNVPLAMEIMVKSSLPFAVSADFPEVYRQHELGGES